MRRALRAKPERARQEVRLEHRLNHQLHGGPNDAVADGGNRERAKLLTPGLLNQHPARGQRTPAPLPQLRGQLVQQTRDPVLLDVRDGLSVDAGRALVGAHQLPRALQHVPP